MDEKFLEQASALEQTRRDDALHAARSSLQGPGQSDCEDCGHPIPEGRRLVQPAATRCLACQTTHEHNYFKGFRRA